jgi:DNA (cytosine-5)-methyltransferase 1
MTQSKKRTLRFAARKSRGANFLGIPTLSLFSGAGGLDLGFLAEGYDVKACVEVEKAYCATLHKNLAGENGFHTGTQIICQDVRSFDTKPFLNTGIRCVIGGPPCQTFSAAGRRAGGVIGVEDERGQLFRAYCRILGELKPDVFVFENVYGLPGANGGGAWREILKSFSELGYQLRAEVVDAADYGVPQHRERLFMVGFRRGEFVFPLPTHGPDSVSGLSLVSVEDAIIDLQDPAEPFHGSLGGMYGNLLPLVPEGLNYSYFTAEMKHPEPVFAWRSKFHDLLYKVRRDEPCRTIKAQPGKFTGPFHWKNRHFTVAELKRLQTFPDSYELTGSYARVLEQIGNSVPPRLARAIACSVREQLFSKTSKLELPLRPVEFRSTFRQRQRERSKDFALIAQAAMAEQYGRLPSAEKKISPDTNERYMLNPRTLFDRRRLKSKVTSGLDTMAPIYDVAVSVSGSHIKIDFNTRGAANGSAKIEISGLRKYLPGFDSLSLNGKIARPEDVFHAWGAVEDSLVLRSRFFTLIDIYGHYANRGDTVRIDGQFKLDGPRLVIAALNLFSSSANCGDFIDEAFFRNKLGIGKREMPKIVDAMRDIRFDLRTPITHPIIGSGRVLCTYPFPLLSPRALVASRAMLRHPNNDTMREPIAI